MISAGTGYSAGQNLCSVRSKTAKFRCIFVIYFFDLINDEAEGYYVLYNFESAPEFPAELERIARITDGILRSLVVKK